MRRPCTVLLVERPYLWTRRQWWLHKRLPGTCYRIIENCFCLAVVDVATIELPDGSLTQTEIGLVQFTDVGGEE